MEGRYYTKPMFRDLTISIVLEAESTICNIRISRTVQTKVFGVLSYKTHQA